MKLYGNFEGFPLYIVHCSGFLVGKDRKKHLQNSDLRNHQLTKLQTAGRAALRSGKPIKPSSTLPKVRLGGPVTHR